MKEDVPPWKFVDWDHHYEPTGEYVSLEELNKLRKICPTEGIQLPDGRVVILRDSNEKRIQ